MKEVAPFTGFGINYDSRNPESRQSYPFVNVLMMPEEGSQLIAVSVKHFSGTVDDPETEDWQFPIFRDLLQYAIDMSPDDFPTVALYEGGERTIDLQDSVEAALLREGDPGMFAWIMQGRDIPAESWDLTMEEEVRQLLFMHERGGTPLADFLQDTWSSPREFRQSIGFFEVGKYAAQYLRQLIEERRRGNVTLGSFNDYVQPRLETKGMVTLFADNEIDITKESLQATHDEVCAKASVNLPFDPSEAASGTCDPDDYMNLHFPPTNASSADYFLKYPLPQRLGGIIGRILRNERLADKLTCELSLPQRVIVAAGGRHVIEALKIMHEEKEYGLPLNMLETYVGEMACREYIEHDWGNRSARHLR